MDGNGKEWQSIGQPMDGGEGNISSEISPPRVGRIVQAKYWSWTHNYSGPSPAAKLEAFFNKKGWQYFFGHETAPTTGQKHLQGYLGHTKEIRPNEGHELVRKTSWFKSKGSYDQNIEYCSKEATDLRTNIIQEMPPLDDPMEGLEPYWWQKEILDRLPNKPTYRKLYWYWEQGGCAGKTVLAKHICMNYRALLVGGKAADIKNGIVTYLEKHGRIDVIIFHFVRSEEEFISYAAIESVLDGIFFSGKYEAGMVMFNVPHLIVLANFEPKLEKLSSDRWNVTNIGEKEISLFE